jgi:hypothetical protein
MKQKYVNPTARDLPGLQSATGDSCRNGSIAQGSGIPTCNPWGSTASGGTCDADGLAVTACAFGGIPHSVCITTGGTVG